MVRVIGGSSTVDEELKKVPLLEGYLSHIGRKRCLRFEDFVVCVKIVASFD